MTSVLLRHGHVYSPEDPFATAMLVAEGRIAWIGDDSGAQLHADDAEVALDLRGAWVAPAFVDAHVHLTSTGLALNGLDLAGAASLAEFLHRLRDAAASGAGVLLGHGWDETHWPEARPPTTAEVDSCVGDRPAYLSRADVHSALASTSLRARVPEVAGLDGWSADGPVAREAHHVVREAALGSITREQRAHAQRSALDVAAERGIASLHENGGPIISGVDDFLEALALGRDPHLPEVIGYWGEFAGQDAARELGARGAAGDLFVDGSIGSHTACLSSPYVDVEPPTTGAAYLGEDEVAAHVAASTLAGQQAGFHVIGDQAARIVAQGLATAAAQVGVEAMRAARHRLEHLEMPDAADLALLADLGVVASVQPAFDAAWGGSEGMYAQRLGAARASTLNPFASMVARGVVLAFGSDAPVTPLDPWGSVRAAAWHTHASHRISVRAAFAAHTRGGRRAARDESLEPGVLAVGAPATYAVWEPGPLVVQAPDGRIAAWSTDPRSGTPPLPDMQAESPRCWRTVRSGNTLFDSGDLA
jgi:predicted amidohydrolase YtcJ